jgi:hypothetical protein
MKRMKGMKVSGRKTFMFFMFFMLRFEDPRQGQGQSPRVNI